MGSEEEAGAETTIEDWEMVEVDEVGGRCEGAEATEDDRSPYRSSPKSEPESEAICVCVCVKWKVWWLRCEGTGR